MDFEEVEKTTWGNSVHHFIGHCRDGLLDHGPVWLH